MIQFTEVLRSYTRTKDATIKSQDLLPLIGRLENKTGHTYDKVAIHMIYDKVYSLQKPHDLTQEQKTQQ